MEEESPFRDLPPYAVALMARLMELSDASFVIVVRDDLPTDRVFRVASRGRPNHVLTVHRRCRDHLAHFVVSSAVKLIRLYELSPSDRLIPVPLDEDQLPPQYEAESFVSNGAINPDVERRNRMLYRALISQLTATPIDLRVERVIANTLPRHRQRQRRCLEYEIGVHEDLFDAVDEGVDVEHVQLASKAMGIAYVLEAADIAEVRPPAYVKEGPYHDIASELIEYLHAENDPSARGDRRITDSWAEELGLRGWYEWLRLEES